MAAGLLRGLGSVGGQFPLGMIPNALNQGGGPLFDINSGLGFGRGNMGAKSLVRFGSVDPNASLGGAILGSIAAMIKHQADVTTGKKNFLPIFGYGAGVGPRGSAQRAGGSGPELQGPARWQGPYGMPQ